VHGEASIAEPTAGGIIPSATRFSGKDEGKMMNDEKGPVPSFFEAGKLLS
jgi:hypothetical protein